MKRREALEKLKQMLQDNTDLYAGELNINEHQILHFVENELGMLPNSVCWLATGDYGPAKELLTLAEDDYDARLMWKEEL